jgi:PST family polysaccharide transporter
MLKTYTQILINRLLGEGSREMVRVTFMNGVSTVIKFITGLISLKIIASLIGPSGVALLGQLSNFANILQQVANGGINSGITKYVSEHSISEKKTELFIGTGFWITVICSVATGIALIVGASYFSKVILYDIQYRSVFIIFGFTMLFYALNAYLIAVVNGIKDYRLYFYINITGSIVGLIFSVTLAVYYGLIGALIATVTFQSVVFFLSVYIARKSSWFRISGFINKFSKAVSMKLAKFSLMALVSAITVPGGQLIVRKIITHHESIQQAGIWEGMNRISGMYLFVIMTSFSVYYLPRLSELKASKDLRDEVYGVYKLIIPFMVVSTISIYFLREFLIRLLFTPEFLEMQELFVFQLLGDFFKVTSWVLGFLLIAKAMTRSYIIFELMNFFVLILSSVFLIDKYGTIGATYAYTITHFIYLVCMVILFRKIVFYKDEPAG